MKTLVALVCLCVALNSRGADEANQDPKLRVASLPLNENDKAELRRHAGDANPWLVFDADLLVENLSDGRFLGRQVLHLQVLRKGSNRKLAIMSEALLFGTEFRVKKLQNDDLVFEVRRIESGALICEVSYKLVFPDDLHAPFLRGVPVEVF